MDRFSSVVGGWSVAVTRALTALGYDASRMLSDAGVDIDCAYDPDARFSSAHTRKLWRMAREETGREDIGLEVAKFVCPTTFHALGFSLLASESLLAALERMVRYNDLLNDGSTLSLVEGNAQVTLVMTVHNDTRGRPQVANEGVDYFLGATLKLFRDIHDPGFSPCSADLIRPAPADISPYQKYFGSPINFAAERNALLFDRKVITQRLPTANPELALENDKIVADYMSRHWPDDTVAMVEAKLIELLALGEPSQEKIAQALRTNVRTLQYRLSQRGTSYKQILNETRQRLAEQYLQHSRITITEISYLLGFSDPAHFNRAFKRWRGITPTDFRG